MTDLQTLVDSSEQDELHLPPGHWTGGLVIARSLRLIGPEDGPPCVIDGEALRSCVTVEAGVTVHLERVTLVNGAGPQGGGLCCTGDVQATLVDVRIRGCRATYFGGGGIYVERGSLRVDRCILQKNEAPQGGALLANKFADVTVVQSLVVRNAAQLGGGLCLKDAADVALHGVTIADNGASDGGSQIYGHGTQRRAPSLTIVNTVLSPADDGDPGIEMGPSTQPDVAIRSSLLPISARTPAAGWTDDTTQFSDPAFVDHTSYRLHPNSPARRAADHSSLGGAETDLAGRPLDSPEIDIGALQG